MRLEATCHNAEENRSSHVGRRDASSTHLHLSCISDIRWSTAEFNNSFYTSVIPDFQGSPNLLQFHLHGGFLFFSTLLLAYTSFRLWSFKFDREFSPADPLSQAADNPPGLGRASVSTCSIRSSSISPVTLDVLAISGFKIPYSEY